MDPGGRLPASRISDLDHDHAGLAPFSQGTAQAAPSPPTRTPRPCTEQPASQGALASQCQPAGLLWAVGQGTDQANDSCVLAVLSIGQRQGAAVACMDGSGMQLCRRRCRSTKAPFCRLHAPPRTTAAPLSPQFVLHLFLCKRVEVGANELDHGRLLCSNHVQSLDMQVTWSGVPQPSYADVVALYVPALADPALTSPVKYAFAHRAATHMALGVGSLE